MSDSHPRGPTVAAVEKLVEEIWWDVLGASQERPAATFFDLQGQSISAVRIVTRIEDELGTGVDIGILFEDPNLTTFTHEVIKAWRAGAGSEVA